MKVEDTNYIKIYGSMTTKLKLKGNELFVYAIIYSFCTNGNEWFAGSIPYLMEWTGASKKTIIETLKSLVDKELIERKDSENSFSSAPLYRPMGLQNYTEWLQNYTERCKNYTTTEVKKLHRGGVKITPGGCKNYTASGVKTTPNNNSDNNRESYIYNNNPLSSPTEKINFSEVKDLYNQICIDLPKVKDITDKRKKAIKTLLKKYTIGDIEVVFEKAQASDFLSGRKGNWSGCGFDWLTNPNNFVKVIEGNYDDKRKRSKIEEWDLA